jgi:hypothetical protein
VLNDHETATGDHVIVNATYPEFNLPNMPEFEVDSMTISFLSGVYFVDTKPLVIPDGSYDPFNGIIQLDQFGWNVVHGINEFDLVDIEVDFTNNDCDVMAWWLGTDNSTWTYGNNILGSYGIWSSSRAYYVCGFPDWFNSCWLFRLRS